MSEQQEFPDWAAGRPGRPDIPGELASIGQRFVARLIDTVVFLVPTLIVTLPVFTRMSREMAELGPGADPTAMQRRLSGSFLRATLTMLVISAVYEIALVATRGQTLGKMALRIRVVRADGSVPGWGPAAIRWGVPAVPNVLGRVIGAFSSLVVLLVYLWAIWDDRKQGLHDKAAGTFVIRVPES